ncbi:MAG: hypothetical protein IJI88_08175 [Atopobiaceae bacterium]|nr:hypothetical protein [Atopobiaceae bacterium]
MESPINALFRKPLVVVNVGLETFNDTCIAQGAKSLQVDWKPPAGGDQAMIDLLARLKNA